MTNLAKFGCDKPLEGGSTAIFACNHAKPLKFFSLHPSARCTRVFSSVTLSTCCITATCLQQQLLLFIFSQNCKSGKKLYNVSTEIKGTRCINSACYIRINIIILIHIKSKSSLHSPYYAEVCNELRDPSPRLSAWATQLRRSVATVASCVLI